MRSRWVRSSVTAAALLLCAGAIDAPAASAPARGTWLAGDFHVHTCYSHDSYCGPEDDNTGVDEAYTAGLTVSQQFQLASMKGLDFTAITDHNDIRSQSDPGFASSGVLGIRGYEASFDGHAQILGTGRYYEPGEATTADVLRIRDAVRADGGIFQVNHPADGSTDFPVDADWGYGYDVGPDSVEVWNISRLFQPPLPSGSSTDDAVRYWEGWLDRGERVAATGGSDSHWASTSAVQGVGQPTTWVFASERSEQGIIDGVRSGRTFISHQPPAFRGPRLFLEADGDGDGTYESMVGDVVARGSRVRVRMENAAGTLLRVPRDGGRTVAADVPVPSDDFTHEFVAPRSTRWLRAEIYGPDLGEERRMLCDPLLGGSTTYCRNDLTVFAMTSALFYG